MKCTMCGKPIILVPSAEERAKKSCETPNYYRKLFTIHSYCLVKKRNYMNRQILNKSKMTQDQKIKTYILKCIKEHQESGKNMSINESIDYVKERAKSEITPYSIAKYGEKPALAEWLKGMALDIDYTQEKIVELGYEWCYLPQTKDDIGFVEMYYSIIAEKLTELFEGHKVPRSIK